MELLKVGIGNVAAVLHIPQFSTISPILREFTHKRLCDFKFEPKFKKYTPDRSYSYYDNIRKLLYVPSTFYPLIKQHLLDYGAEVQFEEYDIQPCEPRRINIEMKDWYKPRDNQVDTINWLVTEEQKRKCVPAGTGSGKSNMLIDIISRLKYASLIMLTGLLEQWYNRILEFTTLKPEDIYYIQGFNSIVKLINSDYKPSIIIASLETIREYLKAERLNEVPMSFSSILTKYGIGIKVLDEAHRQFGNTTQIDLRCNPVKLHYYLTATWHVENSSTRRIFNIMYPKEIMFCNIEHVPHVNATFYIYYGSLLPKQVKSRYGYNHAKFEKYLLKVMYRKKHFIDIVLFPVINAHFINIKRDNEKCLIYCATINMINFIVDSLIGLYPSLKISSFVGSDTDDKLNQYDLLVTTIKKTSTGKDIKGLRTIINTVSTQASNDIVQMFGRLRPLNDVSTEYVDVSDGNLLSHNSYMHKRKHILESKASSVNVFEIK